MLQKGLGWKSQSSFPGDSPPFDAVRLAPCKQQPSTKSRSWRRTRLWAREAKEARIAEPKRRPARRDVSRRRHGRRTRRRRCWLLRIPTGPRRRKAPFLHEICDSDTQQVRYGIFELGIRLAGTGARVGKYSFRVHYRKSHTGNRRPGCSLRMRSRNRADAVLKQSSSNPLASRRRDAFAHPDDGLPVDGVLEPRTSGLASPPARTPRRHQNVIFAKPQFALIISENNHNSKNFFLTVR